MVDRLWSKHKNSPGPAGVPRGELRFSARGRRECAQELNEKSLKFEAKSL